MGLLVLEQVGLEQFPGRSALGQSALGQSALGQSALGQSAQRSPAPISFSLAGGEMALLLGAPGSGKTRLLRLINGLQPPSQGQIFWQGKAQADYSPLALRRQIAWLPSQPQLLGMAVGEAIAYPLKLQGLPNSTIQPRLEQWLEILEIPTAWLGRSPTQLTLAEAQQVALARALVLEPQLLLLDDPWPELGADTLSAAWAKTLPLLHQRGTALIWAMGDAAVRAGLAAGAADLAFPAVQRLLCLGEGGLVQDAIATPAAWDVAVKTVASRQVDRPEGLQSPGQWDQDWD